MKYNSEWPARRYDKMGEKEWFRLERDRRGELLYTVHWDILKRHIKSTDAVIELGAGAGKFTKDIANVCRSITTSDISPVQVEFNKNKMTELGLLSKVNGFHVLDITDLSSIDQHSFEVVVCIGGPINYTFDKSKKAIQEMLRILKPNGKLILGSFSKVGAFLYHLDFIRDEKNQFGINATKWLFETGIQDPDHYPVADQHYNQHYTSVDLDNFFSDENVTVIERSSAGLFAQAKEDVLNRIKDDSVLWDLIKEEEIKMTKIPGTIDCGINIIYVVKKNEAI